MFAKDEYDLGSFNGGEHTIDTGNAAPIHCNPHTMPHRLRPLLQEELADMSRRGYIEPSKSSWAAPIVYVKKKDGGWRLCVDFRKLNEVAKINVYPLPRIQDIFSTLAGTRYFSSLDLAKGFWQIKIDEASKQKTAFTTCFGLYQFARLPMGLATAPGAFQEAMSTVLSGLNWVHAMVYLDDILVFSPTFAKHLETLDDVLKRLSSANLRAKLKKCEFARTQLQYLGHVINSRGIMPDDSKVQAVRVFQAPVSRKELETFLGKAGYYCRFIQDFSKVAYPLFRLKRNDVEWSWGAKEQEAFETLKERLCEAPVLRHPDFKQDFLVQTDASGYGIGAVLSQQFEDGEHPIAYASRTLKDAETRYATIEREALGIYWGVRHFEQYLLGGHFTVLTDHKPLESMMRKEHLNTRIQNFVLRLQHFDFTIRYKEGVENGNADALSRSKYPVIELRTQKPKKTQCVLGDETLKWAIKTRKLALKPVVAAARRVAPAQVTQEEEQVPARPAQPPELPLEPEQEAIWNTLKDTRLASNAAWGKLKRGQAADEYLGPVKHFLETGERQGNLRVLEKMDTSMFYLTQDGYLVRTTPASDHAVLCVPAFLAERAIQVCHDAPWGGHLGIKGTIRKAKANFWWPRMSTECTEYVRKCATCARYKAAARRQVVPLGAMSVPAKVWARLHTDHWSVGEAHDGSKGVLAFVDAFSKFAILEPVAEYTAAEVARTYMQKVAPVFGSAEVIVSDGGPAFIAEFEEQFFRACGVARKICVPYRPQANGKIERLFQTLRSIVAALSQKYKKSWTVMLPHAAYAYNTAYHRAIDQTPFYVMYGRDPVSVHGTLAGKFQADEETTVEAMAHLREVRELVREKLLIQRRLYKEQYDQAVAKFYKNFKLHLHQIVWAKAETPSGPVSKLAPKYVGPFRVEYLGDVVAGIVPLAYPNRAPKLVHVDKLKPCLSDDMLGTYDEAELNVPFWLDPNLEEEASETEAPLAAAQAPILPPRPVPKSKARKARVTVQLEGS